MKILNISKNETRECVLEKKISEDNLDSGGNWRGFSVTTTYRVLPEKPKSWKDTDKYSLIHD